MNLLQRFGEGRCASSQPNGLDSVEPVRIEFRGLLHMKDGDASLVAGVDQAVCVMRLPTANHDDGLNLVQ